MPKHSHTKIIIRPVFHIFKQESNNIIWLLSLRGVDQRNYALQWIRQNVRPDENAVVYFADDDNTYHLTLFDEVSN